jgi:hypothetical protein
MRTRPDHHLEDAVIAATALPVCTRPPGGRTSKYSTVVSEEQIESRAEDNYIFTSFLRNIFQFP